MVASKEFKQMLTERRIISKHLQMYFLSELSNSIRLEHCVANLNAVLAKLAHCVNKKGRKFERSLAEADLMACSLLIIFCNNQRVTWNHFQAQPAPTPPGDCTQTC